MPSLQNVLLGNHYANQQYYRLEFLEVWICICSLRLIAWRITSVVLMDFSSLQDTGIDTCKMNEFLGEPVLNV